MEQIAHEPAWTFVDVDGCRVRYRASGDGQPIILLHGLGRSLEDWEPLRHKLSTHRLVAVDLAGFGWSDPLPESNLAALASHVVRTMDACGIASAAHIVGNSLGGAVGMQLAVLAPQRVASLTLVGSAGFGREVTWALRLLDLPLLWRLLLRPNEHTARATERSLYHDPRFASPERIRLALQISRRPGSARTLHQLAGKLGSIAGVHPGWRARLLTSTAALEIPTLVLWGANDKILPATHLINAMAAFPHAHTHLFPDTGHLPQIERVGQFAALLEAFWRGLLPP